jgi:integrase
MKAAFIGRATVGGLEQSTLDTSPGIANERKFTARLGRRSPALTAALKAKQDGLPLPSERQTVAQYLTHWLDDAVKPSVRPRTYVSYSQLVHCYLLPELGRLPLARLAPQDVQAFQKRMLAKGLAPRTVQYMHAVLRRGLGQALRWGLVARNVALQVDAPRVSRIEVRPLTPEQVRAFVEVARGDRLEALYTVALALGLRQGEALGLRWDDVDLEAETLRVRFQLQRIGGTLQLVEPKTERSRRTLVLPDIAVTALRSHRARQLEERLLAGSRWREDGFVFTSTIGTPLDGPNVTKALQRLLIRAGLPRQRFHDLRHCCATLLLAQGVPARVVMEILGHSQISLTMNTYSHVIPELNREAAHRIDAVFAMR